MMVCRLKFANEDEMARPWRVGDKLPYEVWELADAEQVSILADGEEYDYIFDRFRNMPMPEQGFNLRGTLTMRTKTVHFFGDMARFILANL